MMNAASITSQFHTKIPLSAAMGLTVQDVSSQHAVVAVPIQPNINHVHTVFGGALYSAAALACYALFQVIASEAGGLSDELVIQDGSIRYLSPVTADFTVRAELCAGEDTQQFLSALKRHGKARLKLEAKVQCGGRDRAIFTGTYVFKL